MEREVGGGIGMGNTCKPLAVSFQCVTKSTTNKKNKIKIKIKSKITDSYEGRVGSCIPLEYVVGTSCAYVAGLQQLGHEPHMEKPMCYCPGFPKGL